MHRTILSSVDFFLVPLLLFTLTPVFGTGFSDPLLTFFILTVIITVIIIRKGEALMKDSADIRKINKNKILKILWQGGQYTKQQLSVKTELSVATCNTLLNEMERCGEVTGEKKRVQEVGRSTVFYQINEAHESILCITFEVIKGIKLLNRTLLSTLGNVLEQKTANCRILDYSVIEKYISEITEQYDNISQIMIGTPSIAESGIIRHCDIEELENEQIVHKLNRKFHLPVYLENDMHFRAYGYYRKNGSKNDVITLANFPSHILPGTASVHAGTIIKGKNQFAGMVGFLPFGMSRAKLLSMLKMPDGLPLIEKSVVSVIVMINPDKIVFTGDLLNEEILSRIRKSCLNFIPEAYMPDFVFEENMNTYYLEGMYRKALDLRTAQ